MGIIYRIAGWDEHYENHRTRELKNLTYVLLPNKQDGDGYTELMDHPDGPSHHGAWVALLQVASRSRPRGTLVRDGGRPHNFDTLARMTRYPRSVIESAVKRLLDIGWLESQVVEDEPVAEIPRDVAEIPRLPAGESRVPAAHIYSKDNRVEKVIKEKGTAGKTGRSSATPSESEIDFPNELNTTEARKAALEWIDHHRSIGKPYRDANPVNKLLKQWARAGPAEFVAAVEHSIANNYQGLFSPSKSGTHPPRTGAGQQYDPNASTARF